MHSLKFSGFVVQIFEINGGYLWIMVISDYTLIRASQSQSVSQPRLTGRVVRVYSVADSTSCQAPMYDCVRRIEEMPCILDKQEIACSAHPEGVLVTAVLFVYTPYLDASDDH